MNYVSTLPINHCEYCSESFQRQNRSNRMLFDIRSKTFFVHCTYIRWLLLFLLELNWVIWPTLYMNWYDNLNKMKEATSSFIIIVINSNVDLFQNHLCQKMLFTVQNQKKTKQFEPPSFWHKLRETCDILMLLFALSAFWNGNAKAALDLIYLFKIGLNRLIAVTRDKVASEIQYAFNNF